MQTYFSNFINHVIYVDMYANVALTVAYFIVKIDLKNQIYSILILMA